MDSENDYDGIRSIGDEFFYKRNKKRSFQSRDDALYGVFASDSCSDDSDYSGGGRHRSRKRRRDDVSEADLTKPVQLVWFNSKLLPCKEIEENSVKNEGVGKEKSSPGLGVVLGFHADDEVSFLTSAFGRLIKQGTEQRKKERVGENGSNESSSKRNLTGTGNIGTFETHTKGIGMKLMKMMGYKGGTGLGKHEQGIVAPVEAKLRPKNMGIGFSDYKEAKDIPDLQEPIPVSKSGIGTGTVPVSSVNNERLWSKQKKWKKKSKIFTKDELLVQKLDQNVATVQKIIDMRGPQVRVLTNLENINSETESKTNNSIPVRELPSELQHNVCLVVETTEADIQRKDRDLRRERENVASLLIEKEKLEITELSERRRLQNMETIMGIVDQVKHDNGSGLITLDSLIQTFSDLKHRYEEEYKMYNLKVIMCALAQALLEKIYQNWEPLRVPFHGLQIIKSLKDLLQADEPYDYLYLQLINKIIVPPIRINCVNSWQARDPKPMLTFLEAWGSLLPPVILNSILENVIMPKLNQAMHKWNPRVETVPIHVWIHPWLTLLGIKLVILYDLIQSKFGRVLTVWHASDSSALAILSPWKDVFAPTSWDRLMSNSIVPKLRVALQEFEINPANQKLDPFHWVMTWTGYVPVNDMVQLLEKEFFSKWNNALYDWLCSNPDFNEVMKWYMGWKNSFPEKLLADERIQVLFTTSLEMMNKAVEGMRVVPPGTRRNVRYSRVTEKTESGGRSVKNLSRSMQDWSDWSFKECVEKYAWEHGLVFMQKVGKFYNSYQVYYFGNVGVYIDSVKRLLFAQVESGVWSAVTLSQLTKMNRDSENCK